MKKYFISFCFCLASFLASAQAPRPSLKIRHLAGNFYTYESYGEFKGKNYGANGMYLVTGDGVFLFDTPWDSIYYQPLLDSIEAKHHTKVIGCIATHFHTDRTGGLEYYAAKGIKTYTTRMTDSLSVIHHEKRAQYLVAQDTVYSAGGYRFETFYPGPGHSNDNIVIWFPVEKILYGGCFIKSAGEKGLGNIADGNVKEWEHSIKRMRDKFPNPRYIIVGHNSYADTNSISHTLRLIRAYNKKHTQE